MRSTTSSRDLKMLVRYGVAHVGPGWFTSIMGTGILAICIVVSPVPLPFGREAAIALWSVDAALFALFTVLLAASFVVAPRAIGAGFCDPSKAQLWGAPPMAAFTVAVGFLRIGERFLAPGTCITVAQILFVAGAAASVAVALGVPFLMFTRHELSREHTFGSWLLPVVPPIVASVPAALLSDTWPQALRGDMLAFAYALLGIGVILAAIVIVIFYSRLLYDKAPAAPLVPTMWIVVGPLGQSIAGIIALGTAAVGIWPTLGHGLLVAAVAYGVLVWGFAMYWLAMAIAVTLRAAGKGFAFDLGWWAFTFPVGVLIAGTDALYAQTQAGIFAAVSALLLALLAAMWLLVATKTSRGAIANVRGPLYESRDFGRRATI